MSATCHDYMGKRISCVQPNLFSFLPSKISDIHTNKVKRSRVDENEEPDDSSSELEPEFGAEAPPGSASPQLH